MAIITNANTITAIANRSPELLVVRVQQERPRLRVLGLKSLFLVIVLILLCVCCAPLQALVGANKGSRG